jgi:hypothetical protein
MTDICPLPQFLSLWQATAACVSYDIVHDLINVRRLSTLEQNDDGSATILELVIGISMYCAYDTQIQRATMQNGGELCEIIYFQKSCRFADLFTDFLFKCAVLPALSCSFRPPQATPCETL